MSNQAIFTDEARKMYDKFMTELKAELSKTSMDSTERTLTLEDVDRQIVDLCEYKGEDVIGTDILRKVIAKVGTPKEIVSTLERENEFIDEASSRFSLNTTTQESTSQNIQVKARDIITILDGFENVYKLLFPVNVILLIAVYFNYGDDDMLFFWIPMFAVLVLTFGIEVIFMQRVKSTGKLISNKFLFDNIKPDPRKFYLSTIYLFFVLIEIFLTRYFIVWIIVLFVISASAIFFYVQVFYENKEKYLK